MAQPQTTDLAPRGRAATRRPSKHQVAIVQATLRLHAAEVVALERRHVTALLSALEQAQRELARQLSTWIETAPNGELRFTTWKYRTALLQTKNLVAALQEAVFGRLKQGGREAQALSLKHLTSEVARFSAVFGDQLPDLRLNLASIIASGERTKIQHYANSAKRYGWSTESDRSGRPKGVWPDIQRQLAVEILKGSTLRETVDRLVEMGGPKGLVALRGSPGQEGALVELIPEGLFKRYRYYAERLVRTEIAGAYGAQMLDGLEHARHVLPDLQKRWCTDGSGCKYVCEPADGQTVPLNEVFVLGDGSTTDTSPAHPNCQCRVGAWRTHWGDILDSLGLN